MQPVADRVQAIVEAQEILQPEDFYREAHRRVYDAMLASIRASRVIAMDETPIKAGQNGPGKMKQGYFWPVYGELDEVCFPFFDNRRADSVFM